MNPKEALENANLKGSRSYEIIKQALEELEKKDELLKLYREKINILENSKYLNRFGRSFDTEEVNKLLFVTTKIAKLERNLMS